MAAATRRKASKARVEEVVPAAARTVESLRDIGYELPQAVADLVDNSIEARATEVDIDVRFNGTDSWIRIADNGEGMDAATLTEALRYGSERDYDQDALGKFGFGLKTASTSQCRKVTVASRKAKQRARIEVRSLDLDHIAATNRWEILIVEPEDRSDLLTEPLSHHTGSVVLWEDMDRVLDYKDPYGHWAKRRLLELAEEIDNHLAMVFHRFLSGKVRGRRVRMRVNGSPVEPWDPFCVDEQETIQLDPVDIKVQSEGNSGIVHVAPYVLPHQTEFSSVKAWQRASGPLKWNRQQGFYVYRSNRLIQWGGWSRIRTLDEHTKLARIALDFSPALDSAFGINISKAIVKLPSDVRDELEPFAANAARLADQRYRTKGGEGGKAGKGGASRSNRSSGRTGRGSIDRETNSGVKGPSFRKALESAAREAGEGVAMERIVVILKRKSPEVARDLGF